MGFLPISEKGFIEYIERKKKLLDTYNFNEYYREKYGFNIFDRYCKYHINSEKMSNKIRRIRLQELQCVWNVKIINYNDNEFKIQKYRVPIEYNRKATNKNINSDKKEDYTYNYIWKTRNNLYNLLKANEDNLKYFITLTIEPNAVKDRTDNKEVTIKVSNFLRNHKRKFPNFNWVGVKEFHKKRFDNGKKALHFHILSNGEGLDFIDSGYVKVKGIKKAMKKEDAINKGFNDFQIIYNIRQYKYGWNSSILIDNLEHTFKYVLKYINKDMIKNLKEFSYKEKKILRSSNLKKPLIINKYMTRTQLMNYIDIIENEYEMTSNHVNEYLESFYFKKH